MEKKYTIGELANLSGFSRRTIRFYVQKGLLEKPFGSGRGHYYTDQHLATLRKIQHYKEDQLSLEEIEIKLKSPATPKLATAITPSPELWMKIPIIPGVEISVQAGLYPLTPARLKKLQRAVQQVFKREE